MKHFSKTYLIMYSGWFSCMCMKKSLSVVKFFFHINLKWTLDVGSYFRVKVRFSFSMTFSHLTVTHILGKLNDCCCVRVCLAQQLDGVLKAIFSIISEEESDIVIEQMRIMLLHWSVFSHTWTRILRIYQLSYR